MRFAVAFFLTLAFASLAHAEGERRFAHSKITKAEWETYLSEVKAKPGVRRVDDTRPDTDAYFVKAQQTEYFFTTGGPMHPAVVVVSAISGNKGRTLGYFAGAETAFAAWLKTFSNVGPEFQRELAAP
jgi:hypothetical protein